MLSAQLRTLTGALLAGYVLLLALVLLQPVPTVAFGVVGGLERLLIDIGLPAWVTSPGRVEMILNAAMFAPVAFLGSLTWPILPWANWVVYVFVGSAAVELLQGLFLSARSAEFVDLVANTFGALVGVLAARAASRGFVHP